MALRVQAPDGDSFDEMGDITNFPVALITLAVTGLALVFNMGFFIAVGLDFIPLFSIQDHLVFSIGGAVFLLLLLAVMSFPFVVSPAVSFAPPIAIGNKAWFEAITLLESAASATVSVVIAYQISQKAGGSLLTICGSFLFAVRLAVTSGKDNREGVVFALLLLVLGAFMTGHFYGVLRLDEAKNPRITFVMTTDNVRMVVVRAGTEYMLLTSDGSVVTAMKAEKVSAIHSER